MAKASDSAPEKLPWRLEPPGLGVPARRDALGLVIPCRIASPQSPTPFHRATRQYPAVALCSNRISHEQAQKAAHLARQFAGGLVTIFLDCDPAGEEGMKQCLGYLAQFVPVRLAWTSNMHAGKFKGRQPESQTIEEWKEIMVYLQQKNVVLCSLD